MGSEVTLVTHLGVFDVSFGDCSINSAELTTQTVQEALQVRELRLLGRRRILAHVGELLERGSDRHPRHFLICEKTLPTP